MAETTPSNQTTNSFGPIKNSPYNLQYYTGSQASLYIGDVLVDEVINFQYSVHQTKAPIYGYASQLFDAVAPGQVLVQGSFSVNFIEAGYLWLVLNRYKRFENRVDKALSVIGVKNSVPIKNSPFSKTQSGGDINTFLSHNNIQKIINGQASTDEKTALYRNLASYATLNTVADSESAFNQIVDIFENEVWQEDQQDLDQLGRRADDNLYDNFDMFTVFGDFTKPGSSHTVRRIAGVHLLGQSQVVELGSQVFETYNFFARNII